MSLKSAFLPAALVATVLATGCRIQDGGDDGPTAPGAAQITISVSPSPLRFLVVCPPGGSQCFGSLDATVTIAETAGVGGRVDYIDVTLFDAATQRTLSTVRLGSDWLRSQAGTDRIEAGRSLAVRPIVQGYPFPSAEPRPRFEVLMEVGFVDDRGNTLRQGGRFPLETA
jgi:hypothetical protein